MNHQPAPSAEASLRLRLKAEATDATTASDTWLLADFSMNGASGQIDIGSDTVCHGFENHREFRGPRWRSLDSARDFRSCGYYRLVAGDLSLYLFLRGLRPGKGPMRGIFHSGVVKARMPELATVRAALNSPRLGLVIPAPTREFQSLAARRPGRAARRHLRGPCEICGTTENVTLHHLIPFWSGGTTEAMNLVSLCRPCHDQAELDPRWTWEQVWSRKLGPNGYIGRTLAEREGI